MTRLPHLTRRGALLSGLAAAATPAQAQAQLIRQHRNDPVVTTRYGQVKGFRNGDIAVFKGLRYGSATQDRRFRPPLPPEPWHELISATDYGPSSPQLGSDGGMAQSEDCLFLNIWTPGTDAGRRPVMVYIHGGAYSNGSGSSDLYEGTRLARQGDVVVVTLNHRLNVFGYAYLAPLIGGLEDSGNAGQLDLVLALNWVRQNIAVFGGDPSRVMVFGQSGGGAKIATLMATDAARGLFQSAATMSGQQVTASGPLNARRRAETWLSALGLTPQRAHEVLAMPVQALLEATTAEDPILGYGSLYFGPVLDTRTLTHHPFYPRASPVGAHIPMIIGNTREETLGFLGNDPANANLTWDTLVHRMTPAVMRIDADPAVIIAAYRRMRPDWSPDQVLIGATTAGRSWRGAIIEAEERAKAGSPAWVYQLDFPATMPSGRTGAYHTADIPLVFDNVEAASSRTRGPGAQRVSNQMSSAFISLARTGDPNHTEAVRWDRYQLPQRQTMLFDTDTRMVDDPRGDEREFFSAYPYVQPGT